MRMIKVLTINQPGQRDKNYLVPANLISGALYLLGKFHLTIPEEDFALAMKDMFKGQEEG